MTCQTCHDPHRFERGRSGLFSERCLGCHEPDHCSAEAATPEQALECVDCHMPKRRILDTRVETATTVELPLMRDHSIAIPRSRPSEQNRARGGGS